MPLYLIISALLLVLAVLGYRRLAVRRRRQRLLNSTLTDEDRQVVWQAVPLLRRLPAELRPSLEGKINLFLDQVEFIGCNGLQVTDRMRLSIAAQACLLVINRDDWYRHLQTVLIYPGAFKSFDREHDGYVVTERETVRTGESWLYGPVILSWPDAEQGAENDRDGRNVVFHEFAHQLDGLTGATDGVPVMESDRAYGEWERAIQQAFEIHVTRVESGLRTELDSYGANSPEEFFAVAVEQFFEKPGPLAREEPEVYAQLVGVFRVDPRDWG